MCNKVYALVVLAVAAISSLLLFTLSIDHIDKIVIFIKFFESMLPILAVGAVFKYLWTNGKCGSGCCGSEKSATATGASCGHGHH